MAPFRQVVLHGKTRHRVHGTLLKQSIGSGREQGKTRIHGLLPKRLRLAYVSPLPPQTSGIAEYSADLLTALERHYDITLVSETETTDVRLWAFSRLSPK